MSDQPPQPPTGGAAPLAFCPWDAFDPAWYQATYPREGAGPADPEAQYSRVGAARGHGPNRFFDEAWYVASHADVRQAMRAGRFASGFAHYRAVGHATHDPHWLFSERYYRARRPDLTEAALAAAGLRNGYHHYLIAGQNENVSGSPFFDPVLFRDATGIDHQPFSVLLGTPELAALRLSRYFDPDWYLAMHEEAAAEIAAGRYSSGLHHFLANPEPERFPGSPDFDEAFYRRANPEVAAEIAAGTYRSGFHHFLLRGRFEDRRPSRWFDPLHYRRHPRVVEDLGTGVAETAFDHHLRFSAALGLSVVPPAHARVPEDADAAEAQAKDAFARMAHLLATAPPPCGGGPAIVFGHAAGEAVPDVSVVIAAFNQFDLTMQTLASLAGSVGVRFEVILVDNGSRDEVRRIESHVAGLVVLRNAANLGFLQASNQGIAAAAGRHVLLLNNDVLVPPTALANALKRLESDASIGAVAAKVVRTHGLLQEAGSIVFRDGSAMGYGRGGQASAPEYNFVRDVDYGSGVFLLVRGAALRRLGGFDPAYAPAYYEDTDLCARLWQSGLRVVYDPAVAVVHLEFGSSRNPDAPRAQMQRNRDLFVHRHRAWLAGKAAADRGLALQARHSMAAGVRRRHVLVIEDVIPYRHLGSGFVRSADVVASLVALGWQVTVFPMNPMIDPPANRREGFDDGVELLWDHDLTDARRVFAARETLYDVVWVCRAHNLHRLAAVVGGGWGPLRHARVVLDTEALACNREVAQASLEGRRAELSVLLKREMALAHLAHEVVAVNEPEAEQLRGLGIAAVRVLGHAMAPRPTGRGFAERADVLAVGSLYAEGTPNFDGLRWFIEAVWPLVRAELPGVRLLVAGFVADGLDAAGLLAAPWVEHLGFVADLQGLYDQARLFVAPTRFSAGIPYKVHEAAAHGVPVVATARLAAQLGWQDGQELLARDPADAAGFAAAVVSAYRDPVLWDGLRRAALARVEQDCSLAGFAATVRATLSPRDPAEGDVSPAGVRGERIFSVSHAEIDRFFDALDATDPRA